jgi:hypothetical protein
MSAVNQVFLKLGRTGLALALLLASSAATADDAKVEADARFKEGLALAKQGKYAEARTKYQQAYALDERPSLLLSLAIVEHASQRYVEAIDHLRRYFDSPKSPKEKQQEAELRDTLWKQLWAQTGHLRVTAPKGASLKVDGKPAGRAPLADVIDVLPGSHVVVADDETRSVVAPAGETSEVAFGASTPSAGAAVVGPAPITEPPTESERPFWDTGRILGVSALGVGAVGFGLSFAFNSASNSKATHGDDLAKQLGPSPCGGGASVSGCADLNDVRDAQQRNATLSTVFVIAGSAFVATGVVLMVWPRGGARLSPSAGPRGAGLSLSGTF